MKSFAIEQPVEIEVQVLGERLLYRTFRPGDEVNLLKQFKRPRDGSDLLQLICLLRELPEPDHLFSVGRKVLPEPLTEILALLYKNDFFFGRSGLDDTDQVRRRWFLDRLQQKIGELDPFFAAVEDGSVSDYQVKIGLPFKPSYRKDQAARFMLVDMTTFIDLQLLCLIESSRDRDAVRRCEVCGNFFIQKKYSHGGLCHLTHVDGVTCTEKRCRDNAAEKIAADPMLQLYRKIYKRNYMRCDRLLNHGQAGGPLSPGDDPLFSQWSDVIRVTRDSYRNKVLTPEEFSLSLQELDEQYRTLSRIHSTSLDGRFDERDAAKDAGTVEKSAENATEQVPKQIESANVGVPSPLLGVLPSPLPNLLANSLPNQLPDTLPNVLPETLPSISPNTPPNPEHFPYTPPG